MARGNTFLNDVLKLVFNATAIADIAEDDATSPATNLYVSLHTADPGAGGAQNTSEMAYTSYARVAVARTTSGFVVANQTVGFVDNVAFPTSTGGTGGTALYFGIGKSSSGAGVLYFTGAISPGIVVTTGVTPELSSASRAAPSAI